SPCRRLAVIAAAGEESLGGNLPVSPFPFHMRAELRCRARQHVVQGLELRSGSANRLPVSLDGRPVTALDRPRQLEAVVDRPPHERNERFGGSAGGAEQLSGDLVKRDEVVRRDRSARVVERPDFVRQLEWSESERLREPEPGAPRFFGLARDGCPGAVELLWSPRARERLQWMDAEAPPVRL